MTDSIAVVVDEEPPTMTVVDRAMRGDPDAFDRLIRSRLDRQVRFAMSLLMDQAAAHDVVQETCLRAWRDLPGLRDPSRFDSWLNQILVNVARTHLKRHRRTVIREVSVEEMGVDRGPSAGGPADVVLERDAIRRAFARLHPDKRLLLVLRHVDGRSVLDIARLLRIPEGTAKWRLHAARAELQSALDAEER